MNRRVVKKYLRRRIPVAYVVVRVSTEDQVKGQSISVQIRNGKELAEGIGLTRIKVVREVGVNANGARLKLEAVLNRLKPGDVVIFDDLSRMSRNGADARQIGRRVKAAHARLLTCREGIDSEKTSWCCIAAICEVLMKREGEVLRGKRIDGRHMKADQGLWAGGSRPLGYRKKGQDLGIDLHEADTVREIFQRRHDGHELSEIVNYLKNSQYKTKRGGQWTPKTVKDILGNGIYFGWLFQTLGHSIYLHYREDLRIVEGLSMAKAAGNFACVLGG